MVELGPVPEKGKSVRVPENGRIGTNIEKGSGRVSGKVVSRRVPENGRIRANTEEG